MKSLLVLTVVLCLIQYGLTIKCYNCAGHFSRQCGDLFDINAKEQPTVTIEECDKKCVTVKYNLRGDNMYKRECSDIDWCQKLKDDHIDGNGICKECTTDLCNTELL